MICKKCGKTLDEEFYVCPYCGEPIYYENLEDELNIEKPTSNSPIQQSKKMDASKSPKKKWLIGILLILAVIVVGFIFQNCFSFSGLFGPQQPPLTEEERVAQGLVYQIKQNLKNPESLQVHSIKYFKRDEGIEQSIREGETFKVLRPYADKNYYFVIDYSAENSFGGMNRVKAYGLVFKDGSMSIYTNESNQGILSGYEQANIIIEMYALYLSSADIDVNRIV